MEFDNTEGLTRRNSNYTYKASDESARLASEDEALAAENDRLLPDDKAQDITQISTDANSHGQQRSKNPCRILVRSALFLMVSALILVFIFWDYSHVASVLGQSHGHTAHHRPRDILAISCHPEEHIFRESSTLSYNFTITSAIRNPDGVMKRVYLVNGAFPGPTIECRTGDFLLIHVTNALDDGDGLALHWHGLEMRNSNHMDGAVGFTQSPIPAGSAFTYEFQVNEKLSGTFWWHAHSHLQRGDGLYGGLIVHQPVASQKEQPLPESLLLIGDWYHQNAQDVLAWYTSVIAIGNEVSANP